MWFFKTLEYSKMTIQLAQAVGTLVQTFWAEKVKEMLHIFAATLGEFLYISQNISMLTTL